jgi:hypothetical protein
MSDSQNEQNSGVGDEGTIPESDDGIAVGVSDGSGTTFEPEEDPSGAAGADGSGTTGPGEEDADGKPRPDSHNAETNEDTVSGGPA